MDFASLEVEGVELGSRPPDGYDLRVGRGVLAGAYFVIPL